MRELNQKIIAILLFLVLPAGVLPNNTKAVCKGGIELITSVESYDDVRCKNMSRLDLSDRPSLPATLQFNLDTIWPAPDKMPTGRDPNQILTDAMNPGLGVRALHQRGITGAGVNVAIIDQAMYLDHPEFAGKIVEYYDLASGEQSSMHGPAVTSLLAGENCGTAPGAQVYYCAVRSWVYEVDYAQALNWIVQQNESLPESEKIRVVSVSAAPGVAGYPSEMSEPKWSDARSQAETTGILVLDCTIAHGFIQRCWYDVNDPENVAKCTPGEPDEEPYFPPEYILAPSWPRTVAEENLQGDFGYIYGRNGQSWSIPYTAGVLAMGWQIRPELSKEKMVDLLFRTAYVNPDGARIINPPAFINLLEANSPAIRLNAEEFVFYTDSSVHNPDSQTLLISNGLLGTLNWTINETCDWLQVIPNSGSSTGEDDINAVTLSIIELPLGAHTYQLTISDPSAINNPQIVSITLYVSDPNAQTIQDSIDAAEDGDTVIIYPGIYLGEGNRDLDFEGKAITVRSIDPNDPDIIAATIIDCQGTESEPHRAFRFHNDEDANSVLAGFTITRGYANWGGAIICLSSSPTIANCVFADNTARGGGGIENEYSNPTLINCTFINNSATWVGGGIRNHTSSPRFNNCLFTANSAEFGGGMHNENSNSNPNLTNCTLSDNFASIWGGGICNGSSEPPPSPVLRNCIFWSNTDERGVDQSAQIYSGTPIINYSCIQGWTGSLGGIGNIGANPLFADAENGDYHLKSEVGRWDPESESWAINDVTSPCIDTGDPNSDWTAELWPHGRRINMGAYGGTPQASMSPNTIGNIADLDCDSFIGYADLELFAKRWLDIETLLAEDLDRNGTVDYCDFAILGANWHDWQTPSLLDEAIAKANISYNQISEEGFSR